jgi:hypothetical protein
MNDKDFDHTFFDKTDSELHDMIYSGLYTDQGFINAAIEELRYRRAIKSLNSFTVFLNDEIMKLLKREDIFPSDVNRRIRDEAVKRKLVAPRLYATDLHKHPVRNEEPYRNSTPHHRSLIYNEIKDVPGKGPARSYENKYTPPPAYVPPTDQHRNADLHLNPVRKHVPVKRTPGKYKSNYWVLKIGKYILISAALVLTFLIIDILRPDLRTNLFNPSDSTLIEKIEHPIEKFGNKLGLNHNDKFQAEVENLLKIKYMFDIIALPVCDGSATKENTKLKYDKLQNEGLISYSTCNDSGNTGYCATLTDKGKIYAVSEVYKDDLDSKNYINVRSNLLEVGKILNIKKSTQFEGFEVEFILKVIATPFGIIWSGFNTETITKTEMIEKSGQGWRIKGSI